MSQPENEEVGAVRLDEDLHPGQVLVIDGVHYEVHGETPTALELVAISPTSEMALAGSAVADPGQEVLFPSASIFLLKTSDKT